MGKKSQISLEFISIFGIAILITLILGGVFFTISSSEKNKLDISQINEIGLDIISLSEQVYFRGSGNKVQYRANFPQGLDGLEINQIVGTQNYSELNFIYISSEFGLTNISFYTSENYIKLNCSYSCNYNSTTKRGWFNSSDYNSGNKIISIKSLGDQVLIDFVR